MIKMERKKRKQTGVSESLTSLTERSAMYCAGLCFALTSSEIKEKKLKEVNEEGTGYSIVFDFEKFNKEAK